VSVFARGCAAALLLTWNFGAAAQTTIVEPSAAQRCLTRGTLLLGSPEYPEEPYRLKQGAKVLVELSFERADAAPRIERLKVEQGEGSEAAFERSVRRFIDDYRVPCLKDGDTASVRQEFLFVPHDGRPVAMFATQEQAPSSRHEVRPVPSLTTIDCHVTTARAPSRHFSFITFKSKATSVLS
jgi:hypothetical protein